MKKERKLRLTLERALSSIQKIILRNLRREARESTKGLIANVKAISDVPNDPELWDEAKGKFFDEIGGQTDDLLLEGVAQAERLGLLVDFELVNQQVLDYAGTFKNEWWNRLAGTTQNGMRRAIQTHIETGAPLRQLEHNLEPLFGKTRAQVIASTETTRMFAEGNKLAYKSAGIGEIEFQSVNDGLVCPICEPYHGKKFPIDSAPTPPIHPRCRCLTDNQLFVYTAKGKVRFKHLKVGDLVLTHKGRFRPITEILYNGRDNRRKVKLFVRQKEKFWGKYAEKKLPVTEDHPVYTPEGWKEVRDLSSGDTVYLAGHLCEVCKSRMAFVYQRTCSEKCAGQLRARGLWDNPKSRRQAEQAISEDAIRAYRDGRRDPKVQTEKARAGYIAKYGRLGVNMGDEFHRKGMAALGRAHNGSFLERKMEWLLDEKGLVYQRNHQIRANGARYYPDFILTGKKIIVECDGEYWHQDEEQKAARDAALASKGYRILHFSGQEIREDLASCAKAIDTLIANDEHEFGVVKVEVVRIEDTHLSPRASKVTHNLEVADDHSFVAAGFVVHNCWIAPVTDEGEVLKQPEGVEAPEPFISDIDDLAVRRGSYGDILNKARESNEILKARWGKNPAFKELARASQRFGSASTPIREASRAAMQGRIADVAQAAKDAASVLTKNLRTAPIQKKSLWRGMQFGPKTSMDELKTAWRVGSTTDVPISSVSYAKDVAKFFANGRKKIPVKGKHVMMEFRDTQGLPITAFSKHATELESLIGGRFEVISAVSRGDNLNVVLKQIASL